MEQWERFLAARTAANLTTSQAAKKAGVSPVTISKSENPSKSELGNVTVCAKVADAYGVSLDWLLLERGAMKADTSLQSAKAYTQLSDDALAAVHDLNEEQRENLDILLRNLSSGNGKEFLSSLTEFGKDCSASRIDKLTEICFREQKEHSEFNPISIWVALKAFQMHHYELAETVQNFIDDSFKYRETKGKYESRFSLCSEESDNWEETWQTYSDDINLIEKIREERENGISKTDNE